MSADLQVRYDALLVEFAACKKNWEQAIGLNAELEARVAELEAFKESSARLPTVVNIVEVEVERLRVDHERALAERDIATDAVNKQCDRITKLNQDLATAQAALHRALALLFDRNARDEWKVQNAIKAIKDHLLEPE